MWLRAKNRIEINSRITKHCVKFTKNLPTWQLRYKIKATSQISTKTFNYFIKARKYSANYKFVIIGAITDLANI